MPLTFEYGVADGQLLIGVNNGIDNFASTAGEPLASWLYKDTLATLPGDATGIFMNLEQITPLIAEAEAAYASNTAGSMPDASKAYADSPRRRKLSCLRRGFAGNFGLAMNGNGKACEDFFAAATPEASRPLPRS